MQLSRKRGWRKPDNAIVVSRPTIYGNPFVGPDAVHAYCQFLFELKSGRFCELLANSLNLDVEITFAKPIKQRQTLKKILFPEQGKSVLAGHELCCWCALNKSCHVDVLLLAVNDPEAFDSMADYLQSNPKEKQRKQNEICL